MSTMNPRVKYILALLPFWVIPVALLYCSALVDKLPTIIQAAYGWLYQLGLVGWGPISVGAVIATIVGLIFSFVDVLRKGIVFAVLGFLSPFAAFVFVCGSSCFSAGNLQPLVPMFIATILPGIVLAFIAWKFHP